MRWYNQSFESYLTKWLFYGDKENNKQCIATSSDDDEDVDDDDDDDFDKLKLKNDNLCT